MVTVRIVNPTLFSGGKEKSVREGVNEAKLTWGPATRDAFRMQGKADLIRFGGNLDFSRSNQNLRPGIHETMVGGSLQ